MGEVFEWKKNKDLFWKEQKIEKTKKKCLYEISSFVHFPDSQVNTNYLVPSSDSAIILCSHRPTIILSLYIIIILCVRKLKVERNFFARVCGASYMTNDNDLFFLIDYATYKDITIQTSFHYLFHKAYFYTIRIVQLKDII